MKKALITGICGQDAAYMSHLLLDKGYDVVGVGRTIEDQKLWRLKELDIEKNIDIRSGDITDAGFMFQLLHKLQPDECYNFAAISFVGQSWIIPSTALAINSGAVFTLLQAIRDISPHTRLYQPGSSEMFGKPEHAPQNEQTPFAPCNPYGVSKLSAYHAGRIYREAYGLFVANALCFNHESPLRGVEYVTRKITDQVVKLKHGDIKEIRLGNIESKRDWGYAPEYVDAMWRMLQQDAPDDFVLSTGVTHSIKDFLAYAFEAVGIDNWQSLVVEDPTFYRPLEPFLLCGDSTKAKEKLEWEPHVVLKDIVTRMIERDEERYSHR